MLTPERCDVPLAREGDRNMLGDVSFVLATLVNGTWVGSLTQLQAGSGYWFKSSIEACFNYECAEN